MNKNNNSSFTLGAHIRQARVKVNQSKKTVGPVAAIMLVVGVKALLNGLTIIAACLFFVCLLLCTLKIYFLRKQWQSSFVWTFSLIISIFFLAITLIEWKLKV